MTTIWKFDFAVNDDEQMRAIPYGAQILDVQAQAGLICMWAQVNPEQELVKRYWRVFGTGHEVADGAVYFGTVQMPPFVWHLFEVMR